MPSFYWNHLSAISANWSENTGGLSNWVSTSGGTDNTGGIPGSGDDVFLDGAGSNGQDNGTISANITVKSLDCTGYTGTLTHAASVTLTIAGNGVTCKLSSGMTYTLGSAATSAVLFIGTSGTTNITSNGKTWGNMKFGGVGGTWSLVDTLTLGATATLELTDGTFTANNQNLSVGLFASSGSGTRVVTMGSGTWTITGNAANIWNTFTSTNLTVTPGASVVNCTYSGATGTRTIITSTATTARIGNLKFPAGTDTVSFINGTTCTGLDFTDFAGTWAGSGALDNAGSLTLSAGLTRTFTGPISFAATSGVHTLTTNGKALASAIAVSGAGGTLLLADALSTTGYLDTVVGTLDTNGQSVTVASFSSSYTSVRAIVLSSSVITITGSGTVVGFTTTTNLTFTPGTSTFRLTNASASNKTFSGGGRTYHDVVFTGAGTGTFTLNGSNTFRDLKMDTPPHTLRLGAAATQTVESLTVSGTAGNLMTIEVFAGTTATLSCRKGHVICDYLSVKDIKAIGGARWWAGVHSTNVSGNGGWRFAGASNRSASANSSQVNV